MVIAPQRQQVTNSDFVFSNENCCFRCAKMLFDMQKRYYCGITQKPVKPYNKACVRFNEISGRFGGFTKT